MGKGYDFKCKKCKKEYSVFLGIGSLMPLDFDEIVSKIKNGIYGDEYKLIFNSTKYAVPDIEKELYICKSCGQWAVEENMNLYAPNHPEGVLRENTKCVMQSDLKEDYHLVKRWVHNCKCGKRMHKASKEEMENLACPYCGTVNTVTGLVMWD